MTGRPHSLLLLDTELQNSQGLSRVCLAGWSIRPFLLRPLLCHGSFSRQTLFLGGYTRRGGDGGERETAPGGAEGLVFSGSTSAVNHLTSVSPSRKWDQAPQRTWQRTPQETFNTRHRSLGSDLRAGVVSLLTGSLVQCHLGLQRESANPACGLCLDGPRVKNRFLHFEV